MQTQEHTSSQRVGAFGAVLGFGLGLVAVYGSIGDALLLLVCTAIGFGLARAWSAVTSDPERLQRLWEAWTNARQ